MTEDPWTDHDPQPGDFDADVRATDKIPHQRPGPSPDAARRPSTPAGEPSAADLRREFPDMTGLSRSNLHSMRLFAAAWPDSQIVPQAAGQLPWGHIPCLLDKLEGHPHGSGTPPKPARTAGRARS